MKPRRNRHTPGDPRQRVQSTRRRARALEAFISQQILVLHRTRHVTQPDRRVLATPGPCLADQSG